MTTLYNLKPRPEKGAVIQHEGREYLVLRNRGFATDVELDDPLSMEAPVAAAEPEEMFRLRVRVENMEGEIGDLREALAASRAACEDLRGDNSVLRGYIEKQAGDLHEAMRKASLCADDLDELKGTIAGESDLRQVAERANAQLQKDVESFASQVVSLRADVHHITRERDEVTDDLIAAKKERDALFDALAAERDTVDRLTRENLMLVGNEEKVKQLEAQIAALEWSIAGKNEVISNLRRQLTREPWHKRVWAKIWGEGE